MANNNKCAVPWGNIFAHQGEYIDPLYVAPGVKIREPSKMTVGDASSLCNFWRRRQSKSEPALRFKKVDEVHVRVPFGTKKRALDWKEMPWMDLEDGESFQSNESDLEAAACSKKSKGKGRYVKMNPRNYFSCLNSPLGRMGWIIFVGRSMLQHHQLHHRHHHQRSPQARIGGRR
jgi:hypothetical protein